MVYDFVCLDIRRVFRIDLAPILIRFVAMNTEFAFFLFRGITTKKIMKEYKECRAKILSNLKNNL